MEKAEDWKLDSESLHKVKCKDGTIEFAHKVKPFLAADKLLVENRIRQIVNKVNIKGNNNFLILKI